MRPSARPGVEVRELPEHPHVKELVLDRPEALNAVSTELAGSLAAATAELAVDASVRAVVLA